MDQVLGKVDTIELFNQDRESELFLYYRLLNCGLRLTPLGGSDFSWIFDRRLGSSRLYAKVAGPFSWQGYADAIRRGRTAASDGQAFVWLDVAGHEPGETIEREAGGALKVSARAAIRPAGLMRRGTLEIVSNGQVVFARDAEKAGRWGTVAAEIPLERSAWVAARVMYAEGGEDVSSEWGNGRHYYCAAHTGPVYVRVGGKPIRVDRRDSAWLIQWIDAAWASAKALISPSELDAAFAAFEEAKQRYAAIRDECPAGH